MVNINTPAQLNVLERSHAVQWIAGPAASGKTWVLEQKVLNLAQKMAGGKILVLCYNRPLFVYFQMQFRSHPDKIDVMTYNSFVNIDDHLLCYQHIFVDEGQDIVERNWFENLKHFLQSNDDRRHHLWVMYDPNQHVQPIGGNPPPDIQQKVNDAYQLEYVLRSTRNIFEMSKKYYSAIDGTQIKHHGPVGFNIVWDDSLQQEGDMAVVKHVERLKKKKIQMKDICILVENVVKRNALVTLVERKIACQNAEQHINNANQAVIVESIRRFKGLESKIVILFDPPYEQANPRIRVRELLYTAVSRCFCLLIIITTEEGKEALMSENGYM